MEEEQNFEVDKIVKVALIEDNKQIRISIPAEVIEDFNISADRYQFGWIVEKDTNSNLVRLTGKFIPNRYAAKED